MSRSCARAHTKLLIMFEQTTNATPRHGLNPRRRLSVPFTRSDRYTRNQTLQVSSLIKIGPKYIFSFNTRQRPRRRRWAEGSARITTTAAAALSAKRIDPPEDFIDTSAVDEPGTECLAVDFERQELRVIFETMDRNNIFYKMLAVEQIVSVAPPPSSYKMFWSMLFVSRGSTERDGTSCVTPNGGSRPDIKVGCELCEQ